jgi:hypothetical protein
MPINRISHTMDDASFESVKTKIAEITSSLPFLIDLNLDEKKALPRFGDKSVPFVNKALEIAQMNPDAFPRTLDIKEMKNDVDLYSQLYSILQPMRILMDKLEDTFVLAGAEAYSSALLVYKNAKANKNIMDGAESVLDELGRRFVHKVSAETPSVAS